MTSRDETDWVKPAIEKILSGKAEFAELVKFVRRGSLLVRTNAIRQLGKQFPTPESVAVLEESAFDPLNRELIFGRSVSMFSIAGLVAMNRDEAKAAAKRVISTLSKEQRDDLAYHLKSEGLKFADDE